MAKEIKLIISEANDDHIKIAGAISDTGWVITQPLESTKPVELTLEKAGSQLGAAIAYSMKGGTLAKGNRLMFKHPITIKAASDAVTLDDFGLSRAVKLASEGKLTKEAQNSFCDELVEAIADAKVDAKDTGMELSMPLKLEFRDEATKNAFMNLGRKKKIKKIASRIQEFTKSAMCGAKHSGKKKKMKKKRKMAGKVSYASTINEFVKRAERKVALKRLGAFMKRAEGGKAQPPTSTDSTPLKKMLMQLLSGLFDKGAPAGGPDIEGLRRGVEREGDLGRLAETGKVWGGPDDMAQDLPNLRKRYGFDPKAKMKDIIGQTDFDMSRPPQFKGIPEYIPYTETGAKISRKPEK